MCHSDLHGKVQLAYIHAAQSVHLYQRLTEILSKLTGGVELELEQYLQSLDVRTKEAMGHLDRLSPQISRLQGGLDALEHSLSVDLLQKLRVSSPSCILVKILTSAGIYRYSSRWTRQRKVSPRDYLHLITNGP